MTPTHRFLVALSIPGALCLLSAPTLAAWPHDPFIGNVAMCTAANDQYTPTIVSDGAGGAIVTWYDLRSGNSDIYAQRVNAAGVPQWTLNGVALCTAANDQFSPTIVSDGAGGAFVTWYDLRSGTTDIYAQRVSAAGVPQWTLNGVALCTAANNQYDPTIASDGAAGAIVTWQDYRGGVAGDIYAQRVSAAGVPQWIANGVALCTAANDQARPTIASDGAGGAIVTWFDFRSGAGYDIYAQRVNASGAPQWTANGVGICVAANTQFTPTITSDGASGAIVTWYDYRSGTDYDIYAQRVSAAGVQLWSANGVALCTAASDQTFPTIASDGAGGAIVAWIDPRSGADRDIYAQRVSAAGVPQWTANGVALCTAAGDQLYPTIASDGAGGAIVTWFDSRSGTNNDIYAQRVTAAGVLQWSWNGVALCTAAGDQYTPTIVSDGAGGAIVTWYDGRTVTNYDIYAQRIERFGQLGNPEPAITSVKDVPNDQGGKVKVVWSPSYLDADPAYSIGSYWIWRSVPPNVAAEALANGGVLLGEHGAEPKSGVRTFMLWSEGSQTFSWEYVGSQVARGFSSYSYVVPTTSDSVGAGNPRMGVLVEANTAFGSAFWNSAPDSGYSVDNLPPSAPSPFAGAYFAGATHLHWGANSETDLAGYRLYRGASSSFVPGPGNLVTAQPDTGFNDTGAAGSWYKLSAVDSHGNESLFAILGPGGTTDAPGASAFTLALARPAPDPAFGRDVTLRFTLPREGPATLVVMDTQGRLLRTLVSGPRPAGENVLSWDLASDGGEPVPAGLYFLRLSAEGRTLTQRIVALR